MRHAIKSTALAVSVFFLANIPAYSSAQDSAQEASTNLRRVREQIEKEDGRLNELKKNQSQLLAATDALAVELGKAADQKKELLDSVEQLRQEIDRGTRAIAKIQQDVDTRKGGLRQRVVSIYKAQRRTFALDYLFSASSSTDLLKRTHYLTAIANYDRSYLSVLGNLMDSLSHDTSRLNDIQAQKAEALAKSERLEVELAKKREAKAALAAEERDKIKLQEKSLEKLKTSAAKLEAVLAGIMGGESYKPPPEDRTPIISPTPGGGSTTQDIVTTPFNGRGLEGSRGKLLFPVEGEVIQRFGKQKHDEFADMMFVKGLEIHAEVGAKVRAVADGKVVLSQVLPGYGNVVIVDHGQRYYTLYGRLASSLKSSGDNVKSGEPLAVLGETDYKGRNFYFELRVKGKATNPLEFFKNPPPASRS